MGLLVEGVWHDRWYETKESSGRFERSEAQMRNWITRDGAPGPSGRGGFTASPDRYHLYVSLACPWAHRVLIMRQLKRLQALIDISVVHWLMLDQGWTFDRGDGATGDRLGGAKYLREVYTLADPTYSGRVTVPVLWDKYSGTIVSNESSEIIRMLNSAFDEVGAQTGDYYPEPLRDEIDAINARVYETVNNGVYRAGFATTQDAYEEAVLPLFATLNWLEDVLSGQRYLCGDRLTEADIRLFTTLIRFDAVYVGHFKCNKRRIADYASLSRFLADFHALPDVAETIKFDHIKRHYYESHRTINPTGIVPVGPDLPAALVAMGHTDIAIVSEQSR